MTERPRRPHSTPRCVISDYGGVLTTSPRECFAAYQRETGLDLRRLGEAMSLVAAQAGAHPLVALEKGLITEQEFFAALEEHLGAGALRDFREIYFANLHPNEPMIDYMREARRRGLRVAMLTNNVREWEPYWRAKIPDLDDVFDPVVNSAAVGMRKPEPEIYELCVSRLGDGISARECIFIDDVEQNCEAARAAGMHAVYFSDTHQAISAAEALLGP